MRTNFEQDVRAHGLPVGNDRLLILRAPVPAIEFDASMGHRNTRAHREGEMTSLFGHNQRK